MRLFDQTPRDYQELQWYGESAFGYLNRSARPEMAEVRRVLKGWLSRYPEAERRRLCQDFRSRNDWQHYSAFFEVFVHELLLLLGGQPQPHPELGGTAKHPDFPVESSSGCHYVEAVLASDESKEQFDVIWDLGPSEAIRTEFALSSEMRDLEDMGFHVYGAQQRRRLKLGNVVDTWRVATVCVVHETNPAIVEVQDHLHLIALDRTFAK